MAASVPSPSPAAAPAAADEPRSIVAPPVMWRYAHASLRSEGRVCAGIGFRLTAGCMATNQSRLETLKSMQEAFGWCYRMMTDMWERDPAGAPPPGVTGLEASLNMTPQHPESSVRFRVPFWYDERPPTRVPHMQLDSRILLLALAATLKDVADIDTTIREDGVWTTITTEFSGHAATDGAGVVPPPATAAL